MFVPLQRATILLATPKHQNDSTNHLFIILTNANEAKEVLIINITSSDKFDETCILTSQDHSFINRKSYVSYRYCNIIHADKLKKLVIKTYEAISQDTLNKIIKGLYQSRYTKQKIKAFYTHSLK
ncbi:hypothetical protein SPONN_1302 [uncultured Candidatus Thioglobus sp.]|nr:hypothetical protein SPONN_1302 [uncultured Candidatus Thioglobus sp.]